MTRTLVPDPWDEVITNFFVPGTPQAQGSKKHVGNGRMIETNDLLKPWRVKVAQIALQHVHARPIDTPVDIYAEFVFPRLKKHKNNSPLTKPTAPDLDKLQRAIGDALEQDANILTNDSRITHWTTTKRHAAPQEQPGVHITITQPGTPD